MEETIHQYLTTKATITTAHELFSPRNALLHKFVTLLVIRVFFCAYKYMHCSSRFFCVFLNSCFNQFASQIIKSKSLFHSFNSCRLISTVIKNNAE